jgi:hypothetical protein
VNTTPGVMYARANRGLHDAVEVLGVPRYECSKIFSRLAKQPRKQLLVRSDHYLPQLRARLFEIVDSSKHRL